MAQLLKREDFQDKSEEDKREVIGEFIYNHVVRLSNIKQAQEITDNLVSRPYQYLMETIETLDSLRIHVNMYANSHPDDAAPASAVMTEVSDSKEESKEESRMSRAFST
jgi:hypothetical protein